MQARLAATKCLEPIAQAVRAGLDAAKGPTDTGIIESQEYKQAHARIVNLCMNFTLQLLKAQAMLQALSHQIEQPAVEPKGKVTIFRPDGTPA